MRADRDIDEANSAVSIGELLDDKYIITEYLGCGGMGSVYKAQHQVLGNTVAIKILHPRFAADPAAVKRFQREARMISELRHKNILSVLSFGNHSGLIYMAMEFIEGPSLGQLLPEDGSLTAAEATPLFLQICDGMTYAHANSILHRDLKPDNAIIVTNSDGTRVAKIVDFGLAKLLDGSDGQRLTRTGEVLGDPNYMSPEQCMGKQVDPRSDIYSMGCLMYHVLTGAPPFLADNAVATMYKQVDVLPEKFAVKKGLAVALENITLKCLAKKPGDRYSTFQELKDDLESASILPPEKFKTSTSAGRQFNLQAPRKMTVVLAAVVALVAGAAAVAGLWYTGSFSENSIEKERLAAMMKRIAPVKNSVTQAVSSNELREAAGLAEELGDNDSLATIALITARRASLEGVPLDGITIAQKALALPGLADRHRAALMETLGKTLFYAGKYSEADKILSDLYHSPALIAQLPTGRASFGYLLGTTKLRQGKINEAEKIAGTLKFTRLPLNETINLETMFVAELYCRQKKFAEAEQLQHIVLRPYLNDLAKANILERFAEWYAANGDMQRARASASELSALGRDTRSPFIAAASAGTNFIVESYAGNVEKTLRDGKVLIGQLSDPVSPRLLSAVTQAYCQALRKSGNEGEADRTFAATKEKIDQLSMD